MKLLSVTIPSYNSHEYMEKAIKSALVGGDDIEILVVDDGSSDNTLEIALKYEKAYPGIVRAIHKENGGLSSARNAGLDIARGEYIVFVDSDDTVEPTMIADAVQAAGHIPIDVKAQNIDMLSLSAHKFHGPKGIGVLYARQGVSLTSLIEGGTQERGKRAGTEDLPAIMGMAAALEDACAHMDENAKTVSALRDRLIRGLSQIPHSALNGDPVNRLPGNVSFCFEGVEGESLLLLLDAKGICASSGSACTSGSLDPSHVLLAIGRTRELARGSLRLSLCAQNTDEDVDRILEAVPETVQYLRGSSPMWRDLAGGKKPFRL